MNMNLISISYRNSGCLYGFWGEKKFSLWFFV